MDHGRFPADIFHDVDLTTVGPMNLIDIVAQHPKRRPDALAVGNLNSRFEAAIGLAEFILRDQPCRCVVASYVVWSGKCFLNWFDYEFAGYPIRIFILVCVGLMI